MANLGLARAVLATRHVLRTVGLVLAIGLVASCSPVIRNHGYVPAEDELAQVEVG